MAISRGLSAEPAAAEKALAEGLFQDGRTLMDAGKVREACAKFAESQRIDPSVGTLLNLAVCHQKDGKTASAWAEFKEAAALSASIGQHERAEFAERRAAEVEAKLSRLRLEVPQAAPGMVITLNGKELRAAAAAGSGIPVDPGEAAIEAEAPGKRRWSQRVVIGPGPSTTAVTIPPLADDATPADRARAAPPSSPPRRPPPSPPPEGGGAPVRALGFIAGGGGIAGIGVGSVFGALTLAKAADVEEGCDDGDGCSPADVDTNEEARTTATVSTVAFGAGLACLGAGVVMVLMSRSPAKAEASAPVWVAPDIASTGGRVVIGGRW
jgi:hypothetical protein